MIQPDNRLPQWALVLIILSAVVVLLVGPAFFFYIFFRRRAFRVADPSKTDDADDARRFGLVLEEHDAAMTAEFRLMISEHGPAAWQFHPPIEESPNMLVREGVTMLFLSRMRTSQTSVPVPVSLHLKNIFYFEVTVMNKPGGSMVSIGLAPRGYPNYMLGPGWTQWSVGYRSDGRKFVEGRSGTSGEPFGEAFTGGDIIGCGFNTNGSVFFTKNGRALEVAAAPFPSDIALYPSIGATRGVLLNVNFGQEPFAFAPAVQHNLGYMTDFLPSYDIDLTAADGLRADADVIELPRAVLRWSLNSFRSLPPGYDDTGPPPSSAPSSLPRSLRDSGSPTSSLPRAIHHPHHPRVSMLASAGPSPPTRAASRSSVASSASTYSSRPPSYQSNHTASP
ncbi:hypothetical protein H9P43_004726 [Blastocladiella emersonii ATCC 22665]|nr:hypothetical protein H9P43_004726 [Blastocladiella emersonii ATCC 22665]